MIENESKMIENALKMKNELRFKSFDIKAVAEEGDELIISGYGAVFGNIDSYNEVIEKGAFGKTIAERGGRIAFCFQHDIYSAIGKIQEIKEDDYGLHIVCRISDAEPGIKTKVKEGIYKEMSIGYSVLNAKSEVRDGLNVYVLTEIKLYEVSLVTIAANHLAIITGMKAEDQANEIAAQFDRLTAIASGQSLKFELSKLKQICLTTIDALKKEEPAPATPSQQEPQTASLKAEEILKLLNCN